jgi:hypothetical protein
MRHQRWGVILCLLGLGSLPGSGWAQIPVIESGPLTATSIQTTFQAIIQTIQQIALVADSVTNLTPLAGVVIGEGTGEDLQQMAALAEEAMQIGAAANAIGYDVRSIQAQVDQLFGADGWANSLDAYQVKYGRLIALKYESYTYAMKVQALIQSLWHCFHNIQWLLGALKSTIGNLQGTQFVSENLVNLQKLSAQHALNTQAMGRGEAIEKLTEVWMLGSLGTIGNKLFSDHPGWRPDGNCTNNGTLWTCVGE